MHRPDFDPERRESLQQRTGRPTKFRDAFMWPNINQEDLLKPKVLPILLNARGRNSPYEFWRFDVASFRVGYAANAIMSLCSMDITCRLSTPLIRNPT